jgi:shikimate dehydrogenase
LQSLGIDVVHVTRSPIEWEAMRYDTLNAAYLRHCKLVIQCTPVGTYPDTEACIDLPWDGLTPEHLAVDIVYNPAQTAFLKRAEAAGAKTMNGKAMLMAQAEAAWEWWNATT